MAMDIIDHLSMNHINNLTFNQIFDGSTINNNYINDINNENFSETLLDFLQNDIPNNDNRFAANTDNSFATNTDSLPDNASSSTSATVATVDEDTDRRIPKCCCCLTNNVGIVFGCGHACSCNGCEARLTSCPICRQQITARQRLYFS